MNTAGKKGRIKAHLLHMRMEFGGLNRRVSYLAAITIFA